MYSILLVVQMPDKSQNADLYAKWKGFPGKIRENITPSKSLQLLGESVLLISLNDDLRTLCSVVELIPEDLNYKYAIFDEAIEWLPKSKRV